VKAARELWHARLKDVPVERLVFIDESGAKTDMTRTHGRAPRGVRVIDKVPAGHWATTTMIVGGATDTDVFLAYVEHALVPGLRCEDVVILDNLQPHKSPRVRELIEGAAGARLPPYSPDYNPIENMWSKVKRHLRSAAARTFDALQQAVWLALDQVTPGDCVGFFGHCVTLREKARCSSSRTSTLRSHFSTRPRRSRSRVFQAESRVVSLAAMRSE